MTICRTVFPGFILAPLIAICVLLSSPALSAEKREVTIVTSYPPSFFQPFQMAFQKSHPGIDLTIVQRNTASAVRFILGKPDAAVDIFWASAADAFELLKRKGVLRPIARRPTGAPDRVLGYPINDPDGYYLGFALSGYGFVYNPNYLTRHHLQPPRSWQDLLQPGYAGHIGITSPSRSGTTHLIVESLLQAYGWENGWAMLSELGGNLSTVTARSFGVASGVAQNRFGIGLTIDFLARAPDVSGADNVFVLPAEPVFVPASIAVLSRVRHAEAAEQFVDFLLSHEGQKILLDPSINRSPVRPDLDRGLLRREETGGLFPSGGFDARLSAERYGLVNLIFDHYIVRSRATLARLWRKVHDFEAAGLERPDDRTKLAEARRMLGTPPVSADDATLFPRKLEVEGPRGISRTPRQEAFVREMRSAVEHNFATIETLLASISTAPGD